MLKSTIGVAFIGTPFQGSHQGFFTATQLRLNIAISAGGETADELIKYLSNNNRERRQLDDVVQQFCEMVHNNRFKFPIRCFYETQRTDFKKVLGKLSPEYRKELGENDTGIVSYTNLQIIVLQSLTTPAGSRTFSLPSRPRPVRFERQTWNVKQVCRPRG
jgi:hypothetical protein